MIKASLQDEDFTCLNIYALNTGAHRQIQQIITDTKGETDRNIIGDINIILTSTDTHSGHKINKATGVLHDTIEQLRLN